MPMMKPAHELAASHSAAQALGVVLVWAEPSKQVAQSLEPQR